MTVVTLILILCVLGLIAYVIQRWGPIAEPMKGIVMFVLGLVAFVVLIVWLLGIFGIATPDLNIK